jgi:hypothetical protein
MRSSRAIPSKTEARVLAASGGASIAMPPSAVVRILRLLNSCSTSTDAAVGAPAADAAAARRRTHPN